MYRETKKLDASISNGTWKEGVGLDMARPWNHCWSLLSTPEVKMWWTENFKDHAILITTGAKTVSQYLAGDAKISGHASGHLPSSSGNVQHDGNTGSQRQPRVDKVKAKELQIRKGFNAGNCSGEPGKVCPRSNKFIHKCSHCNSGKHSVLDCPQKQSKKKSGPPHSDAPWSKKPKHKGGGKQGGKGW